MIKHLQYQCHFATNTENPEFSIYDLLAQCSNQPNNWILFKVSLENQTLMDGE